MKQLRLDDVGRDYPTDSPVEDLVERFRGAMLGLAVGDALGWPNEFPGHRTKPATRFIEWEKLVGGRFWGYRDRILPGEYSDDTQLTLALARSVLRTGGLDVEKFAYEELPLWLQYERGGGRSVKAAARSLLRPKSTWAANFFRDPDYRNAGANGAAMRTLPVALVSYRDFDRLVADTFRHTIVTHGHPRAIVGALVLGLAVRRSLGGQLEDLPSALIQDLHEARASLEGADDYRPWVAKWNVVGEGSFQRVLSLAFAEITSMLRLAESAPNTRQFMEDVGAFKPETRGSGTATVASAIYIAARSNNNPPERIREAATALGADTDTIAAMTGAILGALLGTNALPADLASDIQDRRYLDATATSLASAAHGASEARTSRQTPMNKGEAIRQLWAWEIGLHEMFWDALRDGDPVNHPTLGRGCIVRKQVLPIGRSGYAAKLVRVSFETGQTCVFHSRVELKTGALGESLLRDLQSA